MKTYLFQYMTFDRDFWQYRMISAKTYEEAVEQFEKKCNDENCVVRIYLCERQFKENKKK